MNVETRTIMQYVAAAIVVLAGGAAVIVFVFDNVSGRSVDVATSALLALLVSFALTALGYNGGSAATSQAIDKANLNTAQVVSAANGNAHEVYNVLNPTQRFATVPGAPAAKTIVQTPPLAPIDPAKSATDASEGP